MSDELKKIPEAYITNAKHWILALLQEEYPDIQWTGGAFYAYVVAPLALLAAAIQRRIDLLMNSLQIINPEQTDTENIDQKAAAAVLNLYDIKPTSATKASGTLLLCMSTDDDVLIMEGHPFETNVYSSGGSPIRFYASKTVRGTRNIREDYDVPLEKVGDTWLFYVPVEAAVPGAHGNIKRGTRLTSLIVIPNLQYITAFDGFTDGKDDEDVVQAAGRISVSQNAAIFGNKDQLLRFIQKNVPAVASHLVDVSVVGTADPVMHRDQRTIFPVSVGGKIDIYVKCRDVQIKYVSKSCLLIDIQNGVGVWKASFSRVESEGVYRVALGAKLIENPDVVEITRGFDRNVEAGEYDFVPDIVHASEAVFSAFQTITVIFRDPNTPVQPNEIGIRTKNYMFTLEYNPVVAPIQKALSSTALRPPFLDPLVRGALPAYVTMRIGFNTRLFTAPRYPEQVKEVIADIVNQAPIGQILSRQFLYGTTYSKRTSTQLPNKGSYSASILGTDGAFYPASSSDDNLLYVTPRYEKGISPTTVAWYLVNPQTDIEIYTYKE